VPHQILRAENFKEPLPVFDYSDDLKLWIVPFIFGGVDAIKVPENPKIENILMKRSKQAIGN